MPGSKETDCDVLVIGGGLAGSMAARDLAEAELSVVLLDARDRLGGRLFSRKISFADRLTEFGGTHINMTYYTTIVRELERYDLPVSYAPDIDEFLNRFDDGTIGKGFPLPPDQWQAFERVMLHILMNAKRINPNRPMDEQSLHDLDVPWTEFLRPLDLPAETLNYVDGWTALNCGSKFEDVSALFLLGFIAGFDHSALALTDVHAKFANGSNSLIECLTQGIDVRLESPVVKVVQDVDSVTITIADGRVLTGRSAILATPVNCWSDVKFEPDLSEVKLSVSKAGHKGHAFKVLALTEHIDSSPMIISARDEVVQHALPDSQNPDGDVLVCFGVARDEFDLSDPKVIEDSLTRARPGIEVRATDHHDWNADPYSKGTWCAHPPGWLGSHHTEMRRREGRLAFAGADVGLRLPGTIDAAAVSGGEAAAELIALLADG